MLDWQFRDKCCQQIGRCHDRRIRLSLAGKRIGGVQLQQDLLGSESRGLAWTTAGFVFSLPKVLVLVHAAGLKV